MFVFEKKMASYVNQVFSSLSCVIYIFLYSGDKRRDNIFLYLKNFTHLYMKFFKKCMPCIYFFHKSIK